MNPTTLSASLAEALVRAGQHEQLRDPWEAGQKARAARPFTITVSREVGARGTAVARGVGKRLGWPVYDHELLERIAKDTNVRPHLLKHVDERPGSWLQECLEAFADPAAVGETAYVRRLRLTLWSLGTGGECVIVGRGAAQLLPEETTLRVRLLAKRDDRVAFMSKELGVSAQEAARHVETRDRDRVRFIREQFHQDPADPQNYDLVLNSSRFTVEECADLVIEALRRLQARAARQT